MPPKVGLGEYNTFDDDGLYGDVEGQEELIREHAQLKGLGFAKEFGGYPERDPVSGYKYSDIKNKLQDIARGPNNEIPRISFIGDPDPVKPAPAPNQLVLNYKPPAPSGKPAPGTILGRDLSPAEKEKALARAKLQEFAAEKYGVNKSGARAARYEIEKQNHRQINQ